MTKSLFQDKHRKLMAHLWETFIGLDDKNSILVEVEDLGKEKMFEHRHKQYYVKIPPRIRGSLTLRLKGLGRKRFKKTGDLFLKLWLNKGEDVCENLWVSDFDARYGAEKRLYANNANIIVLVPPNSYHGLTLRLKGLGNRPGFFRNVEFKNLKRGNLFVKLMLYPEIIQPKYGSFESLTTDDMVQEGWIYRKIDEIFEKVGHSAFPDRPIQAVSVADEFNALGWRGVFSLLKKHLYLECKDIQVKISTRISEPGLCEYKGVVEKDNSKQFNYVISLNHRYINNPFSTAAILAHELCHVVYFERIATVNNFDSNKSRESKLEDEHTVDLLTCMYKLGEFQLRAARELRITFGYFRQELFERMQVITAKKLNTHTTT
jgi:hypothetical protein